MEIVFEKDDVTWQQIIYDLVKNEQMDPWDINVTLIAEKFIQMVRQLKEMDLRISGKVILAAALLLRIKAVKLVEDDVTDFDNLFIDPNEMSEEQFYGDIEAEQLIAQEIKPGEDFQLIPRTPQPRKRKVSVYDLVSALQKALEVKHRRIMRDIPEIRVHLPEYHVDIDVIITKLYDRIETYLKSKEMGKLTFSQLVPSTERLDKVMTFVPLLHLSGQRKIDLLQQQHFGEIEITLPSAKPHDLDMIATGEIEDTMQEQKVNSKKKKEKIKKEKIDDINENIKDENKTIKIIIETRFCLFCDNTTF